MNAQENATAAELLQLIKDRAKAEPEKARAWSEAYKALCAAYEIRTRADKEGKP